MLAAHIRRRPNSSSQALATSPLTSFSGKFLISSMNSLNDFKQAMIDDEIEVAMILGSKSPNNGFVEVPGVCLPI